VLLGEWSGIEKDHSGQHGEQRGDKMPRCENPASHDVVPGSVAVVGASPVRDLR